MISDKEKLERELINAEYDDILLPSNLQLKKEMAEMYEEITNPLKQEQRKLVTKRKNYATINRKKVGLL